MQQRTMNKIELVIIPTPLKGHLVSTVEFATQLMSRDKRFSATILLIKSPLESETEALVHRDNNNEIEFIDVPKPEILPPPELALESMEKYFEHFFGNHKSKVRDIIVKRLINKPANDKVIVVVDMFWSAVIGVAEELGVSSYVFFTSGAAFLGLMFFLNDHLLSRGPGANFSDDHKQSSLDVPSYKHPIPIKFCPSFMLGGDRGWESLAGHAGEFRRAKGIIVNTVFELEPYAVESLLAPSFNPPVYTIGPLLDLGCRDDEVITRWLNEQPPESVVLLCFGSMGAFGGPQLAEIAAGLERSGHRFLWSVRIHGPRDATKKMMVSEFLPEGFSERTAERGKIVAGWVPQAAALAHPAVGGFVSHCGWNSILESVWFGVPVAAWPQYAEQHANAFQVVAETGLAVGLRMGYRRDRGDVVAASEVEAAVRTLMDGSGRGVRKRAAEMRDKCRRAVEEAGSSFVSMERLVEHMCTSKSTID